MTRLALGPDVSVAAEAPLLRYTLSHAALEHLAGRAGTPLPWVPAAGDPLARALGGVSPAAESSDRAPSAPEAVRELIARGLLTASGRAEGRARSALAAFAGAGVLVRVEIGGGGSGRFLAWHRYDADRVTAIAATGDLVELAWWPVARWGHELANLVSGAVPDGADRDESPAAFVSLPYELLLGAGAALRQRRPDLLATLLDRHRGRVAVDGEVVTPVAAERQVRLLHTAGLGRLQLTVAGRDRRAVGLVSWVLYADGWRELVPSRDLGGIRGEPTVEVRAVTPTALGGVVARLVSGVGG